MKKKIRITALILACSMLFAGCSCAPEVSMPDTGSNISSSESSTENSENSENQESSENSSEADKTESKDESSSSPETDSKDESSETTESKEETKKPETEQSEKPETSKPETEKPDDKPTQNSDYTAQWNLSSTWQDGGKYCGGYDVVITNNTGKQVESWTATVTVPNGFEIISGWNAKYKVNGSTLTVTNESYNGTIANGGEISFGFNYSSPKEFTPSYIKFNGSATPSVDGPSNDNNNDNNNNDKPVSTKPVETLPPAPADPDGSTPVSVHGQLSVKGTQIVDKNGNAYQLKGMSTHGIGWFPAFVNESAFKTLRDDWNTNVVRLAMYTGASEGYTGSAMATHEALVKKGIDICIKLDMYVIVDWHILADQSPSVRKADAIRFFDEISKQYADYPNIIYEICNEPNGYSQWDNDIKPYAEDVIPVIRKNDPDSIVIVGTPTWSQDIDKAMANPLKFDNVMYALHFYAATHTDWLRQRVQNCVNNGLPVFVSEFGCCDASGNGANDFNQTKQWLDLLDSLGVSYCNWNLANKNESSSAFKQSASANGNWTESDMNPSGSWIRKWFRGEIQ
ncbi:MAG: endoglucanase [Ruminococcaceae bacterium]|nr:endoglucanase [Oscillospiraceae bacterium]